MSTEPTVLQKDSRILRECLAFVYKRVDPTLKNTIQLALLRYAIEVGKYCEHTDVSFVEVANNFACLDCGVRRYNVNGKPGEIIEKNK